MGIQVSTASHNFLTQVVNCTSGLNCLLSWWKICWWGQISVTANMVTLEQQVAAESCCGDWHGACSPRCRVKLLPESHLWVFWAASQCPRQGVAFLTHFLHWEWVELRYAKAWNAKVSIGITCYNTWTNMFQQLTSTTYSNDPEWWSFFL